MKKSPIYRNLSRSVNASALYIYNGRSPSLSIDSLSFEPFQDTSRRDSDVCLVSDIKEDPGTVKIENT